MLDLTALVERTHRYRRNPGFGGDVTAEILVIAIEPQRPEIGGDEIGSLARQQIETDLIYRTTYPLP